MSHDTTLADIASAVAPGLTIRNVTHPEWGEWRLDRDSFGWTIRNDRGEKMLDEGEFGDWHVVTRPRIEIEQDITRMVLALGFLRETWPKTEPVFVRSSATAAERERAKERLATQQLDAAAYVHRRNAVYSRLESLSVELVTSARCGGHMPDCNGDHCAHYTCSGSLANRWCSGCRPGGAR